MCSRVGADYDKLPMEDKDVCWFNLYAWTEEDQNDYIKWLTDYLLNNTKARRELMSISTKTKKNCLKFAEQFTSWNGWKNAHVAELEDANDSKPFVRKDV